MNKKDFHDISIRGRVAFGIMCFESYVIVKYPEKDFAPVSQLMWDIVSDKDYIDSSAEKYMEIIPEYLYEFDSCGDAEFEFLTPEEFTAMRELIPTDDETLETVMHRIYDIAMEHAYAAVEPPARASIDLLFEIITTLEDENIVLPSVDPILRFSFSNSGGWGEPISYVGLSKILH